MLDELRHAVEHAQRLPDEARRHLATQIEAWLGERKWDAIVGSPHGQEVLAKLIAQAHEGIARGGVEDSRFGR
jgi:hypothetical protein